MDDEMKMAMMVAQHTWRGTSITEGAFAVLADVYSPHDFVGDGNECCRCGEAAANDMHIT
jgi:hypothetical protein